MVERHCAVPRPEGQPLAALRPARSSPARPSDAVSAGEMVLYGTSHPFSIETDAPYDLVVPRVLAPLLGLPATTRSRASRRRCAATSRRRSSHHSSAPARAPGWPTATSPRATRTAWARAPSSLLGALTGAGGLARRPPAGDLLARIKVHIEEHLDGSRISSRRDRRRALVSTRHLQKLLQGRRPDGHRLVRERRARRLRRDLRDPAHADETPHIATRWAAANAPSALLPRPVGARRGVPRGRFRHRISHRDRAMARSRANARGRGARLASGDDRRTEMPRSSSACSTALR